MADYPTQYGYRARFEPRDGSTLTRADSGKPWFHRPWGATQYTITVEHTLITHSDYAALLAFYDSNHAGSVTFTDLTTSDSYTVYMTAPPRKTKTHNGTYCDAQIVLEGTLNG